MKSNFIKFRKIIRYKKDKKMTLIIGARFKDGVILVSDRMITEGDTGRWSFENKLKSPFGTPLFFGAAGYSHKFKQFNRRIIELVGERHLLKRQE